MSDSDLVQRIDDLVVTGYSLLHPYEARLLLECKEALEANSISNAGMVRVPIEPSIKQWGGLARDVLQWWLCDRPTGAALHKHLWSIGREIPEWLEQEIQYVNHVPPKGTVAVVIYKAMIEAATEQEKH